jgi:exonuclease VII large subunit
MNAPYLPQTPIDGPITELTPATAHQLIDVVLSRLVAQKLPEMTGLVAVTGRMTDPGSARGSYHYGAKIVDDTGSQVRARIHKSAVTSAGLQPGDVVRAVGRLVPASGNYGMQVLLEVGDIQKLSADGAVPPPADAGRMSLDRLKRLPLQRRTFPEHPTLTVAVIQSSSTAAQVNRDCQSEFEGLEDLVIVPVPVNMLDPVAIAGALRSSDADIVLLIRGGGDSADFEVFDDPRVVDALVRCPAYRITGLGHSGNGSVADIVADYSARTPGQAGVYLRDSVLERRRREGQAEERLRVETKARQLAEKELAVARQDLQGEISRLKQSARSPLPWILIAFVAGAVATLVLRGI